MVLVMLMLICMQTSLSVFAAEESTDKAVEEKVLNVAPAANGVPLNKNFKIEASKDGEAWVDVPAYLTCTRKGYLATGDTNSMADAAVGTVDCSGEIFFRVTALNIDVKEVSVRPRTYNMDYKLEGNTVSFSVNSPKKLVIDFNDNRYDNVMLFVNEPENYDVDINSPDVMYFGPGYHTYQNDSRIKYCNSQSGLKYEVIFVNSNQTVYIANGAVVRAHIIFTDDESEVMRQWEYAVTKGAKNAKLIGHGIIYQRPYNTADGYQVKNGIIDTTNTCVATNDGINIRHCENITIDGVIMLNPGQYGIRGGQSNHIYINNYKGIDAMTWGDGIDMMSCSDVHISNSFVRSSDDSIAIYTDRFGFMGNAENWYVTDTILYADMAHTIFMGCHGSQDANNKRYIRNINFKDCILMEAHTTSAIYYGTMAIGCGDDNIVSGVTFEDIEVEDFTSSSLLFIQTYKNGAYNPTPGYLVEDIHFKNINYNGANTNASVIQGYDEERVVRNVTFENLTINGDPIVDVEDGNIIIGKYVENVTFKHGEIPGEFKADTSGTKKVETIDVTSADMILKKAPSSLTIDGSDADWKEISCESVHIPENDTQLKISKGAYDGEGDCSMDVKYTYDDNYLYIFANVLDNKIVTINDTSYWNGDSIQIGFDQNGDYGPEYGIIEGGNVYKNSKFIFNETADVKDFKVATVTHDKGIDYEIAVPWTAIFEERPGVGIKTSIHYNDSDSSARKGWIEWTPGINDKNTEQMKILVLEPTCEFVDIENHWAEETIANAMIKGLVSGVDKYHFIPDNLVTRAEFLTMLKNGFAIGTKFYSGVFSDVNGEDWYARTIQGMYTRGLIPKEMVNGDKFMPNQPITREEMIAIMANVYDYKDGVDKEAVKNNYADSSAISVWAVEAVNKMSALDVVNGDDNNMLNPQGEATRAEAVTLIVNLYKLFNEIN